MNKKIVFMGTPSISGQILKSLYQNGLNIEAVYTQPPIASHRGQRTNKSPVHILAETLNLPVRTPYSLENKEELNFLKEKDISLGIVVAYGQILKKNFLNISKNGWINIHYSLLPKLRGAAPIQRAIMNRESSTGISIMRMNEKLDSGPICGQYSINILDNDNILTLCLDFMKFLDGLKPTILDGENLDFKSGNLFSSSKISFFKLS